DAVRAADGRVDFHGVKRLILAFHGVGTVGAAGAFGETIQTDSGRVVTQVIQGASGSATALDVLAHELGHGFGLAAHAAAWLCGAQVVGPGLLTPTAGGGRVARYADGSDVMGVSRRHLSAYHKWLAGWLRPDQVVVVRGNDGDHLLE